MLENIQIEACIYRSRVEKGFSIDRLSGPPNFAFVHFHMPMRILSEGALRDYSENTFAIYQHGTHQLYYPRQGVMLENWMHFDHPDLPEFFHRLSIPLNRPFPAENYAKMDELFRQLNMAVNSPAPYRQELSDLQFNLLMYELAAELQRQESGRANHSVVERFNNLRLSLASNPEAQWQLSRMAEEMNYSVSHFCLLYKNLFGVSPRQDLLNQRLERAKYLLANTDCTIQEISELLSYESASGFTAYFSKTVGISPSKYRKSFQSRY